MSATGSRCPQRSPEDLEVGLIVAQCALRATALARHAPAGDGVGGGQRDAGAAAVVGDQLRLPVQVSGKYSRMLTAGRGGGGPRATEADMVPSGSAFGFCNGADLRER